MKRSTFIVNGVPQTLIFDPETTLMDVIRKGLMLT